MANLLHIDSSPRGDRTTLDTSTSHIVTMQLDTTECPPTHLLSDTFAFQLPHVEIAPHGRAIESPGNSVH